MQSPFPGMDPYPEDHWRDVHARLIVYICDHLQDQLGGGGKLRARVEERLVVEADEVAVRAINPDVCVFESARGDPGGGVAIAAPAAEPLIIPLPAEDQTETYIEIIERGAHDRLVTVIELLSPTNKLGADARRANAIKWQEARSAGANRVEIDLTRAGHRQLAAWPIPKSHRTTFQACVTRAHDRSQPRAEVYRMPLEQPLPVIKVPLRPTDKDVTINLQASVDQAYRRGAHDEIDYTRPPVPPLGRTDAAWAAELLARSAG
jgi:hypothetical protein